MLTKPRLSLSTNLFFFMLYGSIITSLSLAPGEIVNTITYNDKIAHFFGYAAFTFLAWRIDQSPKILMKYGLGIIIYSGLIEVAQTQVGRTMSSLDLLANAIGVVTTAIILCKFHQWINKQ